MWKKPVAVTGLFTRTPHSAGLAAKQAVFRITCFGVLSTNVNCCRAGDCANNLHGKAKLHLMKSITWCRAGDRAGHLRAGPGLHQALPQPGGEADETSWGLSPLSWKHDPSQLMPCSRQQDTMQCCRSCLGLR